MAEAFSLRDHLFNAESLGDLAGEYAAALPGFDPVRFLDETLAGLAPLGLLERLDWIADNLEAQLSRDFPAMANELEAAMPPPLDPSLSDNDFGRFIHAVPGILAVRHGLDGHPERALDLLHAATQRFSMELYIRPFLNRWPDLTMERLRLWAGDPNYHVRRLVSEGTRPRLPWAKAITLPPLEALPLLDQLWDDPTRYVTRSVANHLNDIAKTDPDAVLNRLEHWRETVCENPTERAWLARHALRTLVKEGYPPALAFLGFHPDARIEIAAFDTADNVAIGDQLALGVTLVNGAETEQPVLLDYRITFAGENGRTREKVFKWAIKTLPVGGEVTLAKKHRFKGDATTFRLYPGSHRVTLQINGKTRDHRDFTLLPRNET